ncbi:hypothetical protein ACFE04_031394 [Oxalis oulophora]
MQDQKLYEEGGEEQIMMSCCFDPNSILLPLPDHQQQFVYQHLDQSMDYDDNNNNQNQTFLTSSSTAVNGNLYDPTTTTTTTTLFHHLNLPQAVHLPLLMDILPSLPHTYNLPPPPPLFGVAAVTDHHHIIRNDVLLDAYSGEGLGFVRINGEGEGEEETDIINVVVAGNYTGNNNIITNHSPSERQRRDQWNEKYKALRSLIPHPTKVDRASIVGDAIDYIKELLRTVEELKILVDKKKYATDRKKRQKTMEEGGGGGDMEGSSNGGDSSYNSALRSSWLKRKSKDTEVDVRIIDDEVTIKLVQRKVNCLLFVSKLLDEFQLDLHHVAGGHIGDYYSFLFNTKMEEGSSVYASAIANRVMEVVDTNPAAIF